MVNIQPLRLIATRQYYTTSCNTTTVHKMMDGWTFSSWLITVTLSSVSWRCVASWHSLTCFDVNFTLGHSPSAYGFVFNTSHCSMALFETTASAPDSAQASEERTEPEAYSSTRQCCLPNVWPCVYVRATVYNKLWPSPIHQLHLNYDSKMTSKRYARR